MGAAELAPGRLVLSLSSPALHCRYCHSPVVCLFGTDLLALRLACRRHSGPVRPDPPPPFLHVGFPLAHLAAHLGGLLACSHLRPCVACRPPLLRASPAAEAGALLALRLVLRIRCCLSFCAFVLGGSSPRPHWPVSLRGPQDVEASPCGPSDDSPFRDVLLVLRVSHLGPHRLVSLLGPSC